MKARHLLFILCLGLFLYAPVLAGALENAGIVAYCFDGDTLKLKDRRVIRLAGIDSPEIHRKEKPAHYYGREARDILKNQALAHNVTLTYPGVSVKDPHGRFLAEVLLEDGQSLNEFMVEQGAAWFYPHQDLSPEFQERLRDLQAEAIHEKRGMWAKVLSLPLANRPYIGNKASLRFFPVDCAEAQYIKPRNRVNFGNLMDAFLAGYAPARVFEYWPPENAITTYNQ